MGKQENLCCMQSRYRWVAGPISGETDHCSPSKMLKVTPCLPSQPEMQRGQLHTDVMNTVPLPHGALAVHASQKLLLVVCSPALEPRLLLARE